MPAVKQNAPTQQGAFRRQDAPRMQDAAEEAPSPRRGRDRARPLLPLFKAAFFFLSLAGLVAFVRIFDLQSVLDPAWADSHLDFSSGGAAWKSALLYIALVAALSPAGVPRQALSALGGYAFGAAWGSLFASIGLVFGCAAGFSYSRFLGRESLRPRFGKRVHQLENFLAMRPFAMTMALRFFPMGNNALLNLAAGLTRIPAPAFIGGSAIGYLPQTVIFSLLGSGIRIDPLWRTLASAVLFILASLMGLILYRKCRGELADVSGPDALEHTAAPGEEKK